MLFVGIEVTRRDECCFSDPSFGSSSLESSTFNNSSFGIRALGNHFACSYFFSGTSIKIQLSFIRLSRAPFLRADALLE